MLKLRGNKYTGLRLVCALALCFAVLPTQAQSKTKVVPGSSAGYVYSPGAVNTNAGTSAIGCSKFKMDEAQLTSMGPHGLFNQAYPNPGTGDGDQKFKDFEILGFGTVTGTPPKFTGFLRKKECFVKVATNIRAAEGSCTVHPDMYIARCDDSFDGGVNYGKGTAACVFKLAAGILTVSYYVEVQNLPVSVSSVSSVDCASFGAGLWDRTN